MPLRIPPYGSYVEESWHVRSVSNALQIVKMVATRQQIGLTDLADTQEITWERRCYSSAEWGSFRQLV
jgi:hypothetical protein